MVQKASVFLVFIFFLISAQVHGQAARDTVVYEISPEMVEAAAIDKIEHENKEEFFISVRLKKDYQAEFRQLTGNNIGNLLAIEYEGEVINPILPTIKAKIEQGFSIGSYENKKKAKEVMQRISSGK